MTSTPSKKAKPKSKKNTQTKPASPKRSTDGYKGHSAGSRKGKVHELFDRQGPEHAWTLGLKLGLKQGTLRSWFGLWRRSDKGAKPTKPRSKGAANPSSKSTPKPRSKSAEKSAPGPS